MKEVPQFFADTSSIPQIDWLMALGIFTGITTNPLIVAKEAGQSEPLAYYRELAKKYPKLPISIQLLDEPEDKLFEQAKEFSKIGENIVIKIPMFEDGRALKLLPQLIHKGIKTNVTGLMTAEQVLMVLQAGGNAGPTYASLFFNRIIDGGGDPTLEINRARTLIDKFNSQTKIITGSIRKPQDVFDAVLAGSDIVTITPPIVESMIRHPETIKFIQQSQTAWEEFLANASRKT